MTIEQYALKIIEVVEVLCSSSCPDTGEAVESVAPELQALVRTERERCVAILNRRREALKTFDPGNPGGELELARNEIIRTSPE